MVGMKKMALSMIVGIMFSMILIYIQGQASATQAAQDIRILLNGQEIGLEPSAFYVNQHLMVPARDLFEMMEAGLTWDNSTKTVSVHKGEKLLLVQVGQHSAYMNGRFVRIDQAAVLQEGSMMIPLTLVEQYLGLELLWNESSGVVQMNAVSHDSHLTGLESDNSRSKAAINEVWNRMAPSFSGDPYTHAPQTDGPYVAGALQPAFIDDGVRVINFVRYLAGLPSDVTHRAELDKQAQIGAVLLAASGELSHTPAKPTDMGEEFYQTGYMATASSNIAEYAIRYQGDYVPTKDIPDAPDRLSPATSVMEYMRDEDMYNMEKLGHRRWILNPELKETGFGYAHRLHLQGNERTLQQFSVMKVFTPGPENPETTGIGADRVLWPAEGYFPLSFFPGNDPWSISLSPAQYVQPDPEQVSVQMKRMSDGKTWTLDKADQAISKDKDYFNINVEAYGVPYCLIFRPGGTGPFVDGDRIQVKVTGLLHQDNMPTEIEYEVTFFHLDR